MQAYEWPDKIKDASADAMGNWLCRMGSGAGLHGLHVIKKKQLRWAMQREASKAYTLDIDATQIVAEKHAAHYSYMPDRHVGF